jgi:dihydroorotase
MIKLNNVQTITGASENWDIPSEQSLSLDVSHLLKLPGLIDPHVHFRTPGLEYKEDWTTAAQASIKGGYTTVFDMPNTLPPTVTAQALAEKKALIDDQLQTVGIPLRYQLFFGADKQHFSEIARVQNQVVGIKVFMGCSTGGLVIDDEDSLETIFKIAAENDLLVAVHAEDEQRLQQNARKYPLPQPYAIHSACRDETAAVIAVKKAIQLVRKYRTRLYILHVSTQQEIEQIAQAKAEGLPVFAETTPHHLFLTLTDYETLQGKAVMNPPLRAERHQQALFQAIKEGVIDTVGSDHAPHTSAEKARPYGQCPSGVPGIETTLALLLNAMHQNLLSLENIINLTSKRAESIFRLVPNQDAVLVDLQARRAVEEKNLKTKCHWSPFAGKILQGWPVYTILDNRLYDLATF